jgi:hypothetical protein
MQGWCFGLSTLTVATEVSLDMPDTGTCSAPASDLTIALELPGEVSDTSIGELLRVLPGGLRKFILNLKGCHRLTDAALRSLADSIPGGLEEAHLNFGHCKDIQGSEGMRLLMAALTPSLVEVVFGFSSCKALSSSDFTVLTKGLPSGLRNLTLDLSYTEVCNDWPSSLADGLPDLSKLHVDLTGCHRLTDEGVLLIAQALPKGLIDLRLSFDRCRGLSDGAPRSLAKMLPDRLERLDLTFSNCRKITDEGLTSLARRLPSCLEVLQMAFCGCDELAGVGVDALGSGMPQKLESLRIDFSACTKIPHGGAASLAKGLPTTLRELSLYFLGCRNITDVSVAMLAVALPATLQKLDLDFWGTAATASKLDTLEAVQAWMEKNAEAHVEAQAQVRKMQQPRCSCTIS